VETQGTLCSPCWTTLTFIEEPYCRVCGFPFEHDLGGELECAGCMSESPLYQHARSLVAYDEASRPLLLHLKHGDGLHLAPYFARWMKRLVPTESDLIIPVPLHWTRLFRRSYNQASLLSNVLGKETNIKTIPDALIRTRKTVSQGGLTKSERMKNIKGAFKANSKYLSDLKGRNILLIDDVFTTGATLVECTKVLKKAGANTIYLLTVARVVQPKRNL